MKKLTFILALIVIGLYSNAQFPPQGAMPKIPANGTIYGKITDADGKAVNGASVILMGSKFDTATKKFKEVLLSAQITKANGNFRFESLNPVMPMTLKISYGGFQSVDKKVSLIELPKTGGKTSMPSGNMSSSMPANFQMPDMTKDLGTIKLAPAINDLQAVTVVANKPGLKMEIDKKVFNVEKNIVSAGGTAVDLMKNVPSVNVDIDGNVTLRNATPQLYIDGRPTTLSLDQIPADAIESVEIITNPSAKYDASGGNAGILNLVLKKNKKKGYNGSVNVGVDKRGGINGGANFNVREDKFNFSASVFGNQMKNISTNNTDIRNLLTSPNLLVNQSSTNHMNGGFLFGKVGVDYFASNRTTLSLGLIKVHGDMSPHEYLTSDSLYDGGNYVSYSERNTQTKRVFNATGLQFGLKYLFPKKGEELTADINSFGGINSSDATYLTNIYKTAGGASIGNINQNIQGSGANHFTTIQSDYVLPLKNNGKLEAGVRAQIRNMTNQQSNYYYDYTTNQYTPISSSSSNYKNIDNVYAAYATVTSSIKSFGYQIGLRAESSNYEGEMTDTKQKFNNNYPISLFPSVFLSQKLNDKNELQLNYSRRVNRPFFMQVIPFIDSTNQLNWTRGNPSLKPEFINSFELSYSKKINNNHSLLFSVYYKSSTDLITRYMDTVTSNNVKRPITTYVNANSSQSFGAEITSQNTFTKWWDANTNFNLYNSKINTDNISGTSQDAMWSWFAKMNNNFKLPHNFKVQLSGTYQSKTNLPVNQTSNMAGGPPQMGASQSSAQGYIRANYGVDIAIQKSFLKNNAASVSLSVNDVFKTRYNDQYSESSFYIQNSKRIMDAPMIRLNFSFRFGQMDMSLFKRKNTKGDSEGMQGAMQNVQQ